MTLGGVAGLLSPSSSSKKHKKGKFEAEWEEVRIKELHRICSKSNNQNNAMQILFTKIASLACGLVLLYNLTSGTFYPNDLCTVLDAVTYTVPSVPTSKAASYRVDGLPHCRCRAIMNYLSLCIEMNIFAVTVTACLDRTSMNLSSSTQS